MTVSLIAPIFAAPARLALAAAMSLTLAATLRTQEGKAGSDGKPSIIFDTDMDSDCDDAGALAMLHAMADAGEATILATILSSQSPGSAECTDAINTYYGRPDLPIGRPKGRAANSPSRFTQQIANEFPHDITSVEDLPDATHLYRDLLMAQPDDSVTIVTVGDLTNVANLLKLPAEDGKPSGLEVVRQKVKEWVCMGGNFVGHPAHDDLSLTNNNFTNDKPGSVYAITNWPKKLTFVGREIGSVPSGLKAGARLKELPETNPVRVAYQYYFGGEPKSRHVADQTTVLYAVRGLKDYWEIEDKGYMDIQPDNRFTWKYDTDKNQSYLKKREGGGKELDRKVEKIIEDLMMQPPNGSAAGIQN